MKWFKYLGVRFLAVALALTAIPAAMPSNTPLVGISKAEAQYRDYRGGRGYYRGGRDYRRGGYYRGGRGYYGRDRYYGGRRHYRRHNGGAAVAAGIIGLGVGAALGAAASQPRYSERRYIDGPVYGGRGLTARDRYCLSRYRSYDPASGTYQPYNGPRRYCR
jgi:hypothetical protein